jgi:hypothetical protein
MKLCRFTPGLKALFLESFKLYRALAGLLTYPRFEPPSHIQKMQWLL